jgi:hypothetical protein
MAMNVKPIPALDERINDIRRRTAQIVNEDILPNEAVLWGYHRRGEVSDAHRRAAHELREKIRQRCGKPVSGPDEATDAGRAKDLGPTACRPSSLQVRWPNS